MDGGSFEIQVRVMVSVRIKEWRTLCGITQQDMAGPLGLTQGAYSRIEAGQTVPNAVQLAIICKEFGVPVGALFLP